MNLHDTESIITLTRRGLSSAEQTHVSISNTEVGKMQTAMHMPLKVVVPGLLRKFTIWRSGNAVPSEAGIVPIKFAPAKNSC